MTEKKPRQVSMTLAYPVSLPDGMIMSEITIHRPRAGDMVAIEGATGGEAQRGLMMLAIMARIPIEFVEEIDLEDFTAASELIADFFPQAKGSASAAV